MFGYFTPLNKVPICLACWAKPHNLNAYSQRANCFTTFRPEQSSLQSARCDFSISFLAGPFSIRVRLSGGTQRVYPSSMVCLEVLGPIREASRFVPFAVELFLLLLSSYSSFYPPISGNCDSEDPACHTIGTGSGWRMQSKAKAVMRVWHIWERRPPPSSYG